MSTNLNPPVRVLGLEGLHYFLYIKYGTERDGRVKEIKRKMQQKKTKSKLIRQGSKVDMT